LTSRGKTTLLVIIIGERKNHASSARLLLHAHEEESSIEGPTRQANHQENRSIRKGNIGEQRGRKWGTEKPKKTGAARLFED